MCRPSRHIASRVHDDGNNNNIFVIRNRRLVLTPMERRRDSARRRQYLLTCVVRRRRWYLPHVTRAYTHVPHGLLCRRNAQAHNICGPGETYSKIFVYLKNKSNAVHDTRAYIYTMMPMTEWRLPRVARFSPPRARRTAFLPPLRRLAISAFPMRPKTLRITCRGRIDLPSSGSKRRIESRISLRTRAKGLSWKRNMI